MNIPESGVHIAFYRFVRVDDVAAVCARLGELTDGLLGTVLVATEGVNGMLAAPSARLEEFIAAAADDPVLMGVFAGITYKRTAYERIPFSRKLIKAKREIVPLGVDGLDMPARVDDVSATDVPPHEWRALIRRDDVIVLDNRNSFEFGVGRFKGAVDPGVVNFRDFRDYVEQHAPQWRAEGASRSRCTAPVASGVRSRAPGCKISVCKFTSCRAES
ncbi:hypothetical protein [Calidifontibacter indicus]|uniref:hypothetical protein n=1 Tax=Calidifontibacter indicus TaxID=419650 RepID=UPI003D72912E